MTYNKTSIRYAAVELSDQGPTPVCYSSALEFANGASSGKLMTVAQDDDDKVAEVLDNVAETTVESSDDVPEAGWSVWLGRRKAAAANQKKRLDECDRRSLLVWGEKRHLSSLKVELLCREVGSSALLHNFVIQEGGRDHDWHVRVILDSTLARDKLLALLQPVARARSWHCTKGWTLSEKPQEAAARSKSWKQRSTTRRKGFPLTLMGSCMPILLHYWP